jgi:hypothetical protein
MTYKGGNISKLYSGGAQFESRFTSSVVFSALPDERWTKLFYDVTVALLHYPPDVKI